MHEKITTIILSGGRGRRFGNEDKGMIPWRGKPLIQHVIDQLAPQSDQVLINCNRLLDQYRALGYALFTDRDDSFPGPLAGVLAARDAIAHPWCLLSANDTPLLPDDLVAILLREAQIHHCQVVYPQCGDRHHYLPSLVHSDVLGDIADYLAEGGHSLHGWYARTKFRAVDFSDRAGAFANINSPQTLAALDSK